MNSLICGIVILFVVTVTTCSADDSRSLREDVQHRSKRAMSADQLSARTVAKINEIVDSLKSIGVTSEFMRQLISNILELFHMVVKGAIMFVKQNGKSINAFSLMSASSKVLPVLNALVDSISLILAH